MWVGASLIGFMMGQNRNLRSDHYRKRLWETQVSGISWLEFMNSIFQVDSTEVAQAG